MTQCVTLIPKLHKRYEFDKPYNCGILKDAMNKYLLLTIMIFLVGLIYGAPYSITIEAFRSNIACIKHRTIDIASLAICSEQGATNYSIIVLDKIL